MKQSVAIIGHGTVGKALYKQITGLPDFEVVGVAVKHPSRHRALRQDLITSDAFSLIGRADVGIVLEAIDDADASLRFALATLEAGKVYISASKKMIANNITQLHHAEREFGGRLLYEAAVGGAIPILRTIREHLSGEPVSRIRGIVNGSCNYILTRMAVGKVSFEGALAEAQQKGFAETDPSSDIDAVDSYYKALILAHTAFGDKPDFARIKYEGIRRVRLEDVEAALKAGEKIKLVAEVRREGQRFVIDIRPTHVDKTDPLYHTDWENNAIVVEGTHSGPLLFQGAGAGGNPTASAMVGDLRNAGKGNLETVRKLLLALN